MEKEKNTIFGLSEEEIKRQLSVRQGRDVDPQSEMKPIKSNYSLLEPCIEGGKKILSDPKKKEMFQRIYRR